MALGPDPLKVEPDVPTPADVPDVPLVPEPLIEEPEPDPLRSADDPDVPLAPEPPVNELEPEVPRPADVPDVPLVPEPLIEEPEPDPLRPADDPDVPLAPEPPVNELEPEAPRPADEPDVPLIEEPPPRLPVVLEDWSVQSRVEEPEEALGELLPWARATQVVPAKRPAAKPNRVSCCLIDFSTLSAPNRRSMAGAAVTRDRAALTCAMQARANAASRSELRSAREDLLDHTGDLSCFALTVRGKAISPPSS